MAWRRSDSPSTEREVLKRHLGYFSVEQSFERRPNIVARWKGDSGGKSLLVDGDADIILIWGIRSTSWAIILVGSVASFYYGALS